MHLDQTRYNNEGGARPWLTTTNGVWRRKKEEEEVIGVSFVILIKTLSVEEVYAVQKENPFGKSYSGIH